jgi:2-polyprenyl-3-methyl-5-hydroxy-6-metoxy-1,4-benzoquinol methylase
MKGCAKMESSIERVKEYYDKNAECEWLRLKEHPFEFIFTAFMMEKYVKPGERILDIGGGPGRYSIHFSKMGCDVTLVDLSDANIRLAKKMAVEEGVAFPAHVKNCLALDELHLGMFDHVFLMGPLYHLLDRDEQTEAVKIALGHLKPGGKLYVSFIQIFAGILYDLKYGGNIVRDSSSPETKVLIDAAANGGDYCGTAFTSACFFNQRNILPFMEQFPLKKLRFFGQEGILAPNEPDILTRDPEEIDCWISIAKQYLELPELLTLSEHIMYIGEKAVSK